MAKTASGNSNQVLVNNVAIKREQLKELNTTESAAIDELLVPVSGDPYLLNKLVEDISDEGAEVKIHKVMMDLEIAQSAHASQPQIIDVCIVKCNHGTTFTESVGAYPSVGGIIGVAMSSAHAWKTLAHKFTPVPVANWNTFDPDPELAPARYTRFRINITKWLKMIVKNHGDGAFYPNASDDQYRIVVIRKGYEAAGTYVYISGNFRIEWSSLDTKSFNSI